MTPLMYVSLFIPPLFAAIIFFYLKYTSSQWSYSLLVRSFIWGMVSIVLVLAMQMVASHFGYDKLNNLRRIIFYSLIVTALFAELGKFLVIRVIVYPKEEFRTPLDGILFAIMISMGFSTINNIFYFISIPDLYVNEANAVTSGPANVIFGVLMGFFVGLGKLRRIRFIDTMTGLAAAVFFHALYGFCLLTKDYRLLWAFFIGATIICLSLCFAALRMHADAREYEKS